MISENKRYLNVTTDEMMEWSPTTWLGWWKAGLTVFFSDAATAERSSAFAPILYHGRADLDDHHLKQELAKKLSYYPDGRDAFEAGMLLASQDADCLATDEQIHFLVSVASAVMPNKIGALLRHVLAIIDTKRFIAGDALSVMAYAYQDHATDAEKGALFDAFVPHIAKDKSGYPALSCCIKASNDPVQTLHMFMLLQPVESYKSGFLPHAVEEIAKVFGLPNTASLERAAVQIMIKSGYSPQPKP